MERYFGKLEQIAKRPIKEAPKINKEFELPMEGFLFIGQLIKGSNRQAQLERGLLLRKGKEGPDWWWFLMGAGNAGGSNFSITLGFDRKYKLGVEFNVEGSLHNSHRTFSQTSKGGVETLAKAMHKFSTSSIKKEFEEERRIRVANVVAKNLEPKNLSKNILGILNGVQDGRGNWDYDNKKYWDYIDFYK